MDEDVTGIDPIQELSAIVDKLNELRLSNDSRLLAATILGYSARMYADMFNAKMYKPLQVAEAFSHALAHALTEGESPQVVLMNGDTMITKQ